MIVDVAVTVAALSVFYRLEPLLVPGEVDVAGSISQLVLMGRLKENQSSVVRTFPKGPFSYKSAVRKHYPRASR